MTAAPDRINSSLPAMVTLREVGPRDGLQSEAPVAIEDRVRLIRALIDAGATEIEAVSFVSPKAVPAMAGAADVLDGVRSGGTEGVRLWALVPNVKGAELALAAGVDAISVTVSASEAYSQKNVHMSVDESIDTALSICALTGDVPVDVVISFCFGSPYEGEMDPGVLASIGDRMLAGGATSVTYADTTGTGTPRRVADLLARTGTDVGLHLHETRGTGVVNAYAAALAGVRRFDCSVGGLGGSPFAAAAAGNVATEDLVHLFDDLGVVTGFDLDRLLEASALAAEVIGHAVPSRVAAAGPRTRLTPV